VVSVKRTGDNPVHFAGHALPPGKKTHESYNNGDEAALAALYTEDALL
jgi:hypothetical protein